MIENGWLRVAARGRRWRNDISKRSCGEKIQPVRYGVGQQWREEPVAGGEPGSQLVVIRKIALIVISHRAGPGGINRGSYRRRGQHKSIHLAPVHIYVALIPRWTQVLGADCLVV